MLWLILSFSTALFKSLKDVSSNIGLKYIDEYVVSWSLRFFALPFLLPLLFFIDIPSIGNRFWLSLFTSGSLNVLATILYMKAIKASGLSITIPLLTFTPLFLLLTSPLMLGEFPSSLGLIGVLLIIFGSYTLNINQLREGYLAPFKALLVESGPKLMLIAAFIWSITSNVDKIGVQNSSPILWSIFINIYIMLAMLPIMLYKSNKSVQKIRANYKALLPIGLFSAFSLIFQMTAISMANVAYVISIKRTSVIMSVLFGYLIFKEEGLKERLLGAAIMVFGVLFITIS